MGKNENCCRQCCLKTNHSEGKQISNSSSQNLTSSILDFTENRNHNRFWTKPDQKRKKKIRSKREQKVRNREQNLRDQDEDTIKKRNRREVEIEILEGEGFLEEERSRSRTQTRRETSNAVVRSRRVRWWDPSKAVVEKRDIEFFKLALTQMRRETR